MIRWPRKLVARDHREAYDLWATHFADPALMANRDAESTRRKLAHLAAELPLSKAARVLDVGPGDGALFRIVADRVAACRGIDPSPRAVERLRALFEGAPNVDFDVGAADRIPHPDDAFDVVVINSVLHCLRSVDEIERSLAELARVCRPDGLVFVGELPFRSELDRGVATHLARKLREYGVAAWLRLLVQVYAKPLLRGEPLLLYPATNLHVPASQLRVMARRLGMTSACRRHRETRRASATRNDYFLRFTSEAAAPFSAKTARSRSSKTGAPQRDLA